MSQIQTVYNIKYAITEEVLKKSKTFAYLKLYLKEFAMVTKKILTLVLVTRPNQVLLGMKKRGFGEGWWNGFGGKVEQGETIMEGAKRELEEECCLKAKSVSEVGLINFEFLGDPQLLEVHLFTTQDVEGEPQETNEMKPQWYDIDKIPFDKMWPDDKMWFPYILNGSKISAYFLFEGHHKILKHKIDIVEEIPIT